MDNCPFCQIAAHQLPADFLYEDEEAFVIRDLHPLTPVHLLVIPKAHIASLNEASPEHKVLLADLLFLARRQAAEQGIGDGYRVVINTGAKGGQSVFHLHVHVLGGALISADQLTRGLR